MKPILQLFIGLVSSLAMVAFIFGALLLSLSEDDSFALAFITPEVTASPSPTVAISPVTPPPGITLVASPSPTPTPISNSSVLCPPPPGWRLYTVTAGDQLDQLAAESGTATEELVRANCLLSTTLLPGTLLYLPAAPTATATSPLPATEVPPTAVVPATNTPRPACGPFPGWVLYTVQPGDTLYKISQAVGVSVSQLQQANCLTGTLIQAGTRIYVPYVPTRTPVVIPTSTPGSTSTPTTTNTPVLPSPTPTNTLEPTATNTEVLPTETPTETPTQTATNTTTPPPAPAPSATETVAPAVP